MLQRAEDAVAGIAQTRHDVGVFVEALVDGAGEDLYVRIGILDRLDALGRSDDAEQADVTHTLFAQVLERAVAEPPVASMGSTSRQMRSSTSWGSLQ